MKVMYLDESGNHSLTTPDPDYPLFVLGGIVTDEDYAAGVIEPRVRQLKLELFGRDDLVLHTADIARNRNGFERLRDAEFRERFYRATNRLMSELEYTVVACVVRKDEHLAAYGMAAVDPYLLSLDILVERFYFEIGDSPGGGIIYSEKRSPVLDRELDIAWLNLKIQGTRRVQAIKLNERIVGLQTRSKRDNVAGLQLADLVVSPIGRHVLGKAAHQDWRIVESKLRRRRGTYEGEGLVILPE